MSDVLPPAAARAAQYRKQAEEAEAVSEQVPSALLAESYHRLAMQWRELAQDAERFVH